MSFLKLNKKGVSGTIESAGMFFILILVLALTLQISAFCSTRQVVMSASYEAARAGAKAGPQLCNSVARSRAKEYGEGIVSDWSPNISVSSENKPGGKITVTITSKVPIVSHIFSQAKFTSKSIQVIDELP